MEWAAYANRNRNTDDDESESSEESLRVPVISLAVLGTMSDAGKSTITAGLCRMLTNGGMRVAPFKAQNMSNNAAPALLPDPSRRAKLYHSFQKVIGKKSQAIHDDLKVVDQGYGEIGTAQALQAEACKIVPRVEMNPVLLKSGGRRKDGAFLCSVVVLGKQVACESYGALGKRTTSLKAMVVESHAALAEATGAQVIVLEGAGSCTELNLASRDIVNLPLVRALACPWILVANIDCGGVFAQIVGTKMCVSEQDWSMCVGVVINKLRGEAKYFEPGPKMLQDMVGKPIFVVPHLNDLNLPEEDGLGIERRLKKEYDYAKEVHFEEEEGKPRKPVVVVVAYPHIAIADDLCPLENDPRFEVQWRRRNIPKPFPHTSAVILPGSRLTRLDLKWLHDSGWSRFLLKHYSKGGAILGLCGGYQMLGRSVEDPSEAEGNAGSKKGLALLPVETVIAPAECKIIAPRKATLLSSGIKVEGFELHCGRSTVVAEYQPGYNGRLEPLLLYEDGTKEGLSAGRVNGTYLHGILRSPGAREKLLLGEGEKLPPTTRVEQDPLDRLADHLISCGLDFETVTKMARTKPEKIQSTSGADLAKKDLETSYSEKGRSVGSRFPDKIGESERSHHSQKSNQSEDSLANLSRRSERSQPTEKSRTKRSQRSQNSGRSERSRSFDETELNGDVDLENISAKRNTESSPAAKYNSRRSFRSEKRSDHSRRSETSRHSQDSPTGTGRSRSFDDEVSDGDASFQNTSTNSNTEMSPSAAKHSSQRSFPSGKSGRSEEGKAEHSHSSETRSFDDESMDGDADVQNTSTKLDTEMSPAAAKHNSQRSYLSERSRRSQKSKSNHSRRSHDSSAGRSGISESSHSFEELSFEDEVLDDDAELSSSFDEISFVSEKSRRSGKSQPAHRRRSESSRHSQERPTGRSPNSEVSRSFDDEESDGEDASEMRDSERIRSVKSRPERSRISKTAERDQKRTSNRDNTPRGKHVEGNSSERHNAVDDNSSASSGSFSDVDFESQVKS